MFNYQNRQYIFRRSDGELWNFFHDMKHNLCYHTLTRRRMWSNPVVLHRNTYKYFYVDMDRDDMFHILFQDNEGNINYSRLGGQSIKSVPVLNSKTPLVYNKQLFLAPFKSSVYIFYVLQHENSFLLACQVLSGGKIGSPKVVDYVSGSSLPCSIIYDNNENLYAFYQSHDGKYLQLGYKKFTMAQKSWSDFTPITKYSGNCEYPHALMDNNGVIHLCYQRRAPKCFELVYQQKAPDKNLWSSETIIHSSTYSFENASLLSTNGDIVVYWVRENTIYYNTGQSGNVWSKPARLSFPTSRMLQCLSFKSNSARDASILQGDEQGESQREVLQLPPQIYPGSLSYGLQLAFYPGDTPGDASQQITYSNNDTGDGGVAVKKLLMDAFKKMQGNIDEIREGWSLTKIELAKLTNAYNELLNELNKYAIRVKMLESRLSSSKESPLKKDSLKTDASDEADESKEQKAEPSLPPDKLKEWEDWDGPKEWKE